VFQTHNPRIADAMEANGEVFELVPVHQPAVRELAIPVGRVQTNEEETAQA
jgi:hypothetical protein